VAQTVQRGTSNISQTTAPREGNIAQTSPAKLNAGVQAGQPGKTNVVRTTAPANASSPENTRVARTDNQTLDASKPNTVATKPGAVSPDKKPERIVLASRPGTSSSQQAQKEKQKPNRTFTSSWRQPDAGKKDPPKVDGGKKDKKDSNRTDTRVVDLPPAPPSGFTTAGSHYRVEYEPGLERAAAAVNRWAETAYGYAAGSARTGGGSSSAQPITIRLVSGGQYDGQFQPTGNRGEIVLRVPNNATMTNSPVTNRDALVNIGNPLNFYSALLAHETTHALLWNANRNGTVWRQEGPGSLPDQAAANIGRDATAPQQK